MEKLYFLLNSLYSISLLSSDQWDFSNWLFAKCTVIWLAVRFLWTDTLISWILRHFPGNQIKILFICIFTKSGDVALFLISTIQEFPALNQRNNFKKLNISSFDWKKHFWRNTIHSWYWPGLTSDNPRLFGQGEEHGGGLI